MTATAYRYIELDTSGIAYVAGTQTKVVEIVLEHLAYNWNAEEIHRQHPHLTLSQVYSALAYFYDHQQQIEEDIERRRARADSIFEQLGPSPLTAKLVAAKQGRR
jgi:uncharacterized protein (DUF433 family)